MTPLKQDIGQCAATTTTTYNRSLMESLEQQHEYVITEMSKVRRLQEFLIRQGFYAPAHASLSDIGERVVDGFYG